MFFIRPSGRVAAGVVAAFLFGLLLPRGTLPAQEASARLNGRILDRATSRGIAGAELVLLPESRGVVADSLGRYAFPGLPIGTRQFAVRAKGFAPLTFTVELAAGIDALWNVHLDSLGPDGAQPLGGVTVSTTAPEPVSYRLVDFERRRRSGRGHYRTEEEIVQSRAGRLVDLTRGMRGVAQNCGAGGCRIQMVRARPNCEPDYVVDGRVENMFGATTPIRDIIGLEVYTGPSDVPGEFSGPSSGCGVVVIWTRSGPTRRRQK
jgi:hypothetical protein